MNKSLFIAILVLWGMGINNTYAANSIPNITTQPVSATVTAPAKATFKVTATGTPAPTYQWMEEDPGASTYAAISGATKASYTTAATAVADSGTQFECVVSNIAGSITSSPATLTVNASPGIITQPTSMTVTAPAAATFTITASGTPAPTYQWTQEAPGTTTFIAITGATNASYTTPATSSTDSGTKFKCVVSNAAGSVTSTAATLTVDVVPSITSQPVDATVKAPATATFKVTATGTPAALTYQWMQETPGAVTFTAITGATKASYATAATTVADSGTQYECVISNAAGSVTSNPATLTVNAAPSITTQPSSMTVTAPAAATFTITAAGTPAPTYQWTQEAPGTSTFTTITGETDSSYTTPATTSADSGTKYKCVVSNAAGSVTSTAAILTVNAAPSITTQPVNATVIAPAKATFKVTAAGTPTLTYQWMQEATGTSTFTAITGATKASYTTSATTAAENGTQYECVVSNTQGSITSNAATLIVNPIAPTITTQPTSLTVTAPATATFIIAATGTPSPTYQWMAKAPGLTQFTAITGATSTSYTTENTTVAESGTEYVCVVSNVSGSLTSNVATLTVTAQPPVVNIASPANQSTFTTGSINITAIASENSGTISYVAFYNGPVLLGTVTSTSQAFTYSWTNIPAGTYNLTAVATDTTGGTTTSSPVTVTINSASFTNAIDNNILTKTDQLLHTTSFQYDNLNRLLQITFADASTVSFTYDLFGNQISLTDQRGNVLTKTYDAYERLIQTKDPNGGITQFNYDTDGRLLTLTDANGHNTTYTYDPNGRVLTQTNALNFTTAFTYDPVGNVSTRTDANGQATNYTYDALNRLANTAYPGSTQVTNAYDALGRKTSMTDSTGETDYTYDPLNRLLTKTSPGNNTITYTYDGEGNRLTSIDQNNRTITNTYDNLNRLASVTDPNGTTTYGYDPVSNLSLVTGPNGVTQSYLYDSLNRILTDINIAGTRIVSSFVNVYDVAGMITKKTFADGSWTAYSYDALNRLLEETKQTSTAIIYDYVYTYDPVGNRLTWTKNTTLGGFWSVDSLTMPPQVLTNMTNAGFGSTTNPTRTVTLARSYVYDAGNRLNSWNYAANINVSSFPIQTDTYTYDQNGNRLTKQAVLTGQSATPQQTTYGYDLENRLDQLSYVNVPGITGTQTDNFTYSGEGLRTQAVLNSVAANYLYDGFNVLVEKDNSGNTTKSYTRGLDFGGGIGSLIDQNYTANNTAVTQYYDYNDLGSTADLTTSTGTTASSYSYDAFGNLLTPQASGDTNRYLFSTKEFDSRSGLDYFGARYYDPEIGRWLTPDPIGFRGGQINLYVYVNNNPVNLVDPYGLEEASLPGTGEGSPSGQPDFGPIHAPDLGGKETNPYTNPNGNTPPNNPTNGQQPPSNPQPQPPVNPPAQFIWDFVFSGYASYGPDGYGGSDMDPNGAGANAITLYQMQQEEAQRKRKSKGL